MAWSSQSSPFLTLASTKNDPQFHQDFRISPKREYSGCCMNMAHVDSMVFHSYTAGIIWHINMLPYIIHLERDTWYVTTPNRFISYVLEYLLDLLFCQKHFGMCFCMMEPLSIIQRPLHSNPSLSLYPPHTPSNIISTVEYLFCWPNTWSLWIHANLLQGSKFGRHILVWFCISVYLSSSLVIPRHQPTQYRESIRTVMLEMKERSKEEREGEKKVFGFSLWWANRICDLRQ